MLGPNRRGIIPGNIFEEIIFIMEQPRQIHSSDHIINLSASLPQTSIAQLQIFPTNNSSSNISSMRGDRGRVSSSIAFSKLQLWLGAVFIAVQITASAVVVVFFNHHRSHTYFEELVLSYGVFCFAALPLLYWDYYHLVPISEHDLNISQNACFQRIILIETFISFVMEHTVHRSLYRTWSSLYSESSGTMQTLVNWSGVFLNIAFGYWLIISGTCIISEPALPSFDLYWLIVIFFTHGCFEYILAFFVCPVLSVLGVGPKQGALTEVVDALPTHKFKLNKDTGENGGVMDAGTDMERAISEEDAVCSICLGIYADNDELRELPCTHLHHKDCVDMWLKIKAACPLCNRVIR